MNKLDLIVFNVGHGLSVALIESPENYVTVVDLGREENFSPLMYLSQKRGLRPDILYISHPHGDHLADVDSALRVECIPDFVYYQNYPWDEVIKQEKPELKDKIKQFQKLVSLVPSGEYNGSASLSPWCWTPEKASEIFGRESFVNNSSLFLIYQWRDCKIAIAGDHLSNAIERLCSQSNFIADAKNTDIFIAPHHGHTSPRGFSTLWPQKIGKPFISIISVQSQDPKVDSRYSSPDFAKGLTIGDEKRYALTTRDDGTIIVSMWYNGNGQLHWSFIFE